MTDTRPALTARWRALEGKGWIFETRLYYDGKHADVVGTKDAIEYMGKFLGVPISTQDELFALSNFESFEMNTRNLTRSALQ